MQINDELLDIEGIKKSNKSLIDLFIRRTAVITSTPEHIVEKIVKDQWKNAAKVSKPGSPISELDFCNLGTFYVSPSKAKKRIARLEKKNNEYRELLPDDKAELSLVKNETVINLIKTKIKE